MSKQSRVIAALENAGIERGKPAPEGSERQARLFALWHELDTIEQPIAWSFFCKIARTASRAACRADARTTPEWQAPPAKEDGR